MRLHNLNYRIQKRGTERLPFFHCPSQENDRRGEHPSPTGHRQVTVRPDFSIIGADCKTHVRTHHGHQDRCQPAQRQRCRGRDGISLYHGTACRHPLRVPARPRSLPGCTAVAVCQRPGPGLRHALDVHPEPGGGLRRPRTHSAGAGSLQGVAVGQPPGRQGPRVVWPQADA